MQTRCDGCGKFTKEEDLTCHHTPDSEFTSEEIYYYCNKCEKRYTNK